MAAALLASGLILPVLDGLDEIAEQVRGPAISRINDVLRPGEQVVVTCRSQEYRDAVRPRDGVEVTLRAASGVQLRPLGAEAVRSYLCDDAGGPAAKARWGPALAVIGTEAPVAQALTTPLMVSLARAIFNPRPGELVTALRDPAELCDPVLDDQAAVESLLLDGFIPAAYRNPTGSLAHRSPWSGAEAERWLTFLAHHLDDTVRSSDLAWWQLVMAARVPVGLIFGLCLEVVLGSFFGFGTEVILGLQPRFAILAGLLWTLPLAIRYGRGVSADRRPSSGVRWNRRFAFRALGVLSVLFLLPGILLALRFGLLVVPFAVALWLVAGVGEGTGPAVSDPVAGVSVIAVLKRDQTSALTIGFAASLPFALVAGATLGLVSPTLGVVAGVNMLLIVGPLDAIRWTAWPRCQIACAWLTLHRKLPWRVMNFLADAHHCGILRQVGAVYQFRHIELQRRLASRVVKPANHS